MRIAHISLGSHQHSLSAALRGHATDGYQMLDWTKHPNQQQRAKALQSWGDWNQGVNLVFVQLQTADVFAPGAIRRAFPNARIVGWSGDVRDTLPPFYISLAKTDVDVSLFSNERDVATMQGHGFIADFMDIGFEESVYRQDGPATKAGIVMMANNYLGHRIEYNAFPGFPMSQFRHDLAVRMKKEFGNRFSLYGNGWGKLSDGNLNSSGKEEAKLYRGCSLAVNISHYDLPGGYTSDRLYRMMACGAPIASYDHQDLDRFIHSDEECFAFKTVEELAGIAESALSNPSLGKKMGIRAANRAWTSARWIHRLHSIAEI